MAKDKGDNVSSVIEKYDFVKVNGGTFRYVITKADPSAQWIVFGNSMITDLNVWQAQVNEFKGQYNLLTYDQRGHGGTTDYQKNFKMADLGHDLINICAALNIANIHYVGLSMGVPTGLAAYTEKPELFKSLTLVDGLCKASPVSAKAWVDRIALVKEKGIEAVADESISRWFSEESRANHVCDAVYEMMKATSDSGFVDCAKAMQDFDYEATLENIKVLSLLIAGGNDGNMPNSVAAMGEKIAISSFHCIADAGHNPNVEQSEVFNKLLAQFLANQA